MSLLEFLYEPGVSIILCGDLNFDPIRDCNIFAKITDIFHSLNTESTVAEKTRNNILDYVSTNIPFTKNVIDVHFSDHKVFLFNMNCENVKGSNYDYRRILNDDSICYFLRDLFNENFNEVYALTNVNDAFNAFYEIFEFHFNSNCPSQKFNKKQNKV